MESVGFKEWAVVCEALGRGDQRVILRKGGIAEGRAGFAFRHAAFFLFPTFFHEQLAKTRIPGATLPDRRDEIELRYFAEVQDAKVIKSWKEVEALEPLHVLTRDCVRERFEYGKTPELHVAFVRVFRLEPTWILADQQSYRGCRSWAMLPERPRGTRLIEVKAQLPRAVAD